MLRPALLALASILAASGAALCLTHFTLPGIHLLIWGVVIFSALVFERWRYRNNQRISLEGWEKTGERFEDPETGRVLDVQYDPKSGERRYVDSVDATLRSPP